MRYIELFAGIGGFRYGLEKANNSSQSTKKECDKTEHIKEQECRGVRTFNEKRRDSLLPRPKQPTGDRIFQCVYANEWNKYACQIYRKNYGKGELYEGDITKISAKSIPDFDMLTGGFPCQSFSIAGKRKGMSGKDTRGSLFYEIYRIAKERKPKLLLLENVPGLFSSRDGKDFQTILRSLDEIGYDVEWDCINTSVFLPQNRLRVFIVGHLRGKGGQKVFPIGEGNQTLDKMFGTPRRKQPKTTISGCIGMKQDREHNTYIVQREQFDVSGKGYASQQDRVYKPEGIMCCLPNANPNNKLNIFSGNRIRRLTPTECERLQGFPDGWTEGISDTQRYKCLGNAVTTNVITEIGKKL